MPRPCVSAVWNRAGHFIYVGMAGRGETAAARGLGPFGRLNSHASGRRSGDQFCVYICDRLEVERLVQRGELAAGHPLHLKRAGHRQRME